MKLLTQEQRDALRHVERYLTTQDVAEALEMGVDQVQRHATRGTIPAFKLANVWHFDPDTFVNWMEQKQGLNLPILKPMTEEMALQLHDALGKGKGKLTVRARYLGAILTIPEVATTVIPAEFLESDLLDTL